MGNCVSMSENSVGPSGIVPKGGRFHKLQLSLREAAKVAEKEPSAKNIIKLLLNLSSPLWFALDLGKSKFKFGNIKDYAKGHEVCSKLQVFLRAVCELTTQ
jgi:hypothetical protein